jgi:hypothetical protein
MGSGVGLFLESEWLSFGGGEKDTYIRTEIRVDKVYVIIVC